MNEDEDINGLTPEQVEFLYVYSREYNIGTACDITGIDRETILEWTNINPVFRKKLNSFKEKLLDSAEKTMFQLASKGDFKAAKYILDCLGQERGWGENNKDGLEAFIAPMISAAEAKLLGFINQNGSLVRPDNQQQLTVSKSNTEPKEIKMIEKEEDDGD